MSPTTSNSTKPTDSNGQRPRFGRTHDIILSCLQKSLLSIARAKSCNADERMSKNIPSIGTLQGIQCLLMNAQ
jgi:hypothetical protein